ncbi:MAG: RNA polymerase sigma factor [Acidobacteriota bacterium]
MQAGDTPGDPRTASDEDRELVEQCRQGDEGAFEKLVRKYQQAVFSLVYHKLGSRVDVEDVSQKVFTKIYFSLDRFDNSRPFFPWLYRITINQCHDELRNLRRSRVRTFSDLNIEEIGEIERFINRPPDQTSSTEASPELHALLLKLMDRLRVKHRTAIVLRDVEDLPYEKIAEILGCSEQAARLKVFRARAKLRDLVLKSLRRRELAGPA